MLTIYRSRTPEDCYLDYTMDRRRPQSVPRTPTELESPKSQQEPFVSRSFGSTSSTESSDPFFDLLPWEALFESPVWDPAPSARQSVPSDISRTEQNTPIEPDLDMSDISRLLDPTSIEFGFQHSLLGGLDDKTLFSPVEAFAAMCWESAATANGSSHEEGLDSLAFRCDLASILELDEEPSTPDFNDTVHPIRVPISASLLWSEDDSDSDSEDCRTYHDDYTPVATIHENGTLTALHPVGDFSAIEKEKGLFYRDLTTETFGTFEPVFSLYAADRKESIGQSPIPIIHPENKSVPKRIAAFCHSRFPSRLTATIVRP